MVVEKSENYQVRIIVDEYINKCDRINLFHSVPDLDDEQNESLIDNHEN